MLIESMRAGLEKSSFTFAETGAFIEELDSYHTQIINDVKTALEKGPKEEILRLKPAENPFENTEIEPEKTNDAPLEDVESLTQTQWVELVYSRLENNLESSEYIEDSNGTRRDKDKNASVKVFRLLQPGRWLNIHNEDESIRCKLAMYIEASDKYVFVNGAGTKVAEHTRDELIEAYQNRQVEILQNTPLFERAFKSVLNDLFNSHQLDEPTENIKDSSDNPEPDQQVTPEPDTKQEHTNSNLDSEKSNSQLDSNTSDNNDASTNVVKEDTPDSDDHKIASSTDIKAIDEEQIAKMSVGSWVEMKVGYKMKKCRLAARIASTGKLIFTDRSGIKVKECLDSELISLLKSGDMVLDEEHTIFDKAFSSVISNMRNIKSEKN